MWKGNTCLWRTPKLFHAVRVNLEKIDMGRAASELQRIINDSAIKVSESTVLRNTLITEGMGPNLDIEPEEVEVYVDLSGANRILRGESVPSHCVVGASTSEFGSGEKVSVYVDIRHGCRQGKTLNLSPLEKKIFIGNAVAALSCKEMWPTELNFKYGEYKPVFRWTDQVWKIPNFEDFSVADWGSTDTVLNTLLTALLDPKPGHRVLDMHAGTGAASQYMASIMNNGSRIVALCCGTRTACELIRRNRKLGYSESIDVFPVFDPGQNKWHDFEHNFFDKILLNVPCSDLGLRARFVRDYTQIR